MQKFLHFIIIIFLFSCNNKNQPESPVDYHENYRPQIHYSPKEKWMNDPNGMVFYNGRYNLFYQYYPDSTVWGPMHWGHATSKDLVHWTNQPIALYPDSLGYIFSGSAVADSNNTSGFGANGKIPLVAIFTQHDPKGEKAGTDNFQNESLAYSLDDGMTWTKYTGNPVLKNPGIKDFRDPKVMWHDGIKKWIMTLATKDRVTFYSSPDLKTWAKESEFGKKTGAHGGVWECPDLFQMTDADGKQVWVLLASINPGAPNGGSGTQYFIGQFDGKNFLPFQTDTQWIDYGPDDYAGVTWSNTRNRRIFIGWMSNWNYATLVPTEKWRSAMTIPRELGIERLNNKYFLTSAPVKELSNIEDKIISIENVPASNFDLAQKTGQFSGPVKLHIISDSIKTFSITFSNSSNEKLILGYNSATNNYFIDRSKSGKVDFEKGFAGNFTAPHLSDKSNMEMTIILDNSSVELFSDNGLSVMTAIFFPKKNFSDAVITSPQNFNIKSIQFNKINSIWK